MQKQRKTRLRDETAVTGFSYFSRIINWKNVLVEKKNKKSIKIAKKSPFPPTENRNILPHYGFCLLPFLLIFYGTELARHFI